MKHYRFSFCDLKCQFESKVESQKKKKEEFQTFEEIVFIMWSSAARMTSEFSYVQSCDLEANVQIKICTMEGSLPPLELEELLQNQLLQFCGRKQSKVPDFMIEAVVLGKCV